jgi:hypothetical protein
MRPIVAKQSPVLPMCGRVDLYALFNVLLWKPPFTGNPYSHGGTPKFLHETPIIPWGNPLNRCFQRLLRIIASFVVAPD